LSRIPGLGYAPSCDAGSPALGQHTTEILKEYGYGDVEIDHLNAVTAVIGTNA
jgi:crotonobetainyl-CoA:carnitine CoA-transferase CaiB-like acyl-CoA transferase